MASSLQFSFAKNDNGFPTHSGADLRRALLDTNIILWREAARSPRQDIGALFRWLDALKVEKKIHPASLEEISRYHNNNVVSAIKTRSESYILLKTTAPLIPKIELLYNSSINDNTKTDLILLNELANGRVDFLITEDAGIHRHAKQLNITGVMGIEDFIAKAESEKAALPQYRIPSITKCFIGELNFQDPFFDSLRSSYPGFDRWLHRKADEPAYVLKTPAGIGAFLYLKFENDDEIYSDIDPPFRPNRRLKIGTLKVAYAGFRVGERLLHIAFDAAMRANIDEIYITVHEDGGEKSKLIQLLQYWGFTTHGKKCSNAGREIVLLKRIFSNGSYDSIYHQYPRVRRSSRHFLVPIYPAYHTDLFPESILNTESPANFVEHHPHRNGILKSYISRSFERSAAAGDSLLFYRTASGGPAWHTSVVTTLALVDRLWTDISSFGEFCEICRRRSVFSEDELWHHWNYMPSSRPFVIHLLHVASFDRRPNRKELVERGLIPDKPPRGLVPLSTSQFTSILKLGRINERIIID